MMGSCIIKMNEHEEEKNLKKRKKHKIETQYSPSSLHSSGGFAFLASLGSSHDVVLVLWLWRDDTEREREWESERESDRWGERGDLAEREKEVGWFLIQPENHFREERWVSLACLPLKKVTRETKGWKKKLSANKMAINTFNSLT